MLLLTLKLYFLKYLRGGKLLINKEIMKAFKLFVFALFLFAVYNVQGQTFSNSTTTGTASESFSTQEGRANFISTLNKQRSVAPLTAEQADTSVMIAQIGSNNTTVTNASSDNGTIQVAQRGDDNTTFISVSATELKSTVIQSGNNNNYLNFNVFNQDVHQTEIIQNGNNQNLIRHGGNALSDKLKVSMQGEGQSVIIRSFN